MSRIRRNQNPHPPLTGADDGAALWDTRKKPHIGWARDLAVPLLDAYPTELETRTKHICMPISTIALLTTGEPWEQAKCPSTDEHPGTQNAAHTTDSSSPQRKGSSDIHLNTMNSENIMPRKICQKQKGKYHDAHTRGSVDRQRTQEVQERRAGVRVGGGLANGEPRSNGY